MDWEQERLGGFEGGGDGMKGESSEERQLEWGDISGGGNLVQWRFSGIFEGGSGEDS